MIRSAFTLLALIAMLLMSCEKDELELKSAHRGDIIEIKTNGNLTKAEIEARINEFSAEGWAEYDVTFSSITYRTEYMGKPIDTRGLLLIPNGIDRSEERRVGKERRYWRGGEQQPRTR